jgi:hypothetical protein
MKKYTTEELENRMAESQGDMMEIEDEWFNERESN